MFIQVFYKFLIMNAKTSLGLPHDYSYVLRGDNKTVETLHLYMATIEHMVQDTSGQFSSLISFIQLAVKNVALRLQRLKLGNSLSSINFWPYDVEKLPSIINDEIVHILTNSGCVYQIISNFNEEPITVEPSKQGKYIVCFQGINNEEKNMDCSIPSSTIFAIYRKTLKPEEDSLFGPTLANLKEEYLIASGYAVYAASVNFVLGIRNFGVSHYILDPVLGELVVIEKHIKIPQKAKLISINEGYAYLWEPQIFDYIRKKRDPKIGKPLKTRYIGCLAADFHRILKTGGIYLYPSNRQRPQGRHSLLCECIPLAFIVHLSGGAATTGKFNVLSVHPEKIKQSVPLFIGSGEEVYELLHMSNP